jgi:hypothetical protein
LILLSYLGGSHIVFKALTILFSFTYFKKHPRIDYLRISYIFVLGAGILASIFMTQEVDQRIILQYITFIILLIAGYNLNINFLYRRARSVHIVLITSTIFIWLSGINFSVAKSRLFIDDKTSKIFGNTINGFGSEVNYTAFYLCIICIFFYFSTNRVSFLFLLPVVSFLQDFDIAILFFLFAVLMMIFKSTSLLVAAFIFMLIAIFGVILSLEREVGLVLFGPRYLLWNTSLEIISNFPDLGYGYKNTRDMVAENIIDFDKQYYVHNGFLEAGMAGGPYYLATSVMIILIHLIQCILTKNLNIAFLTIIVLIYTLFNAGFLGSLGLSGVVLSIILGMKMKIEN